MTNFPNPTAQMWLDFDVLPTVAVDLSSEWIDQAIELSSTIPHAEQQWQTYLNVLALGGFKEWLDSRTTNLTLNQEHCSVLQPWVANAIASVCHLKVNKFNLCLITTGSLINEDVTVPRAVIDLPEFMPHFYVLVEVQEEQEVAIIQGFLSHEQLSDRRTTVNLVPDQDWTYQIPLTWFEADPDRLLLYLECLEPTAIPLPVSQIQRPIQLAQLYSELVALLPQLQSPSLRQLWQVLTWEKGATVLTTPELLNWVYQVQRQDASPSITQHSFREHLSDILQLLTQPAINVGRWLGNELDEFAQELSWILLPSLAPAAMRSPTEEFEAIIAQLGQTGVEIPQAARGAYRDLQLAGMPLRLYAVTWPVLSEAIPEWTLLLVLGAKPGTYLPPATQLRVSDQTGVLVEQVLDWEQRDSYFFTSVVGTWDEKFIVTISLGSSIKQTLPPFCFHPEQ